VRGAPGVAALGIVSCLLAAAFAVPPLFVCGVALLLLAAWARASVALMARSVRVERAPSRATVEEQAPLRFAVRVRRGLLSPRGELLSWPHGERVSLRDAVRYGAEFVAHFERRGPHMLAPSVAQIRDPLAISVRERSCAPSEVLVLPRVETIDGGDIARIAGLGRGARRRAADAAAAEVDSLRPYRPGAPASRIHWPTVARTGTLIERRLRTDAERLPLVAIDARRPASDEALDRALRAAASLCVCLAQLGGCALLLPGERRAQLIEPDLGAWPPLHARLALLAPGGAVAASVVERAGVVLWVTASRHGGATRIGRRGAGEQYVVSPFPLRGRPVCFSVAGCTVQLAAGDGSVRVA
jgi:uncharacterized protein (DUF58 family)